MTHQITPAPVDRGEPLIVVESLRKQFRTLDATITAADGITLTVDAGSTVAIVGPSGSGKSTLLHLLGALDRPDDGSITVAGRDITRLNRGQLAAYRREIGFVFQRFNLLPALSVLDNVTVPALPYRSGDDVVAHARELLERVGLAGRENTLATRLSGGQQQRVAIARALLHRPRLILADEPTGNLDTATGHDIMKLLLDLRDQQGATLLVATHDLTLAEQFDRRIEIRVGAVVSDHGGRDPDGEALPR
jgi:putative ABC transport system ATP-binding protein